MKKYSENAHFNDSVEYNGYYYFSERFFNGLFRAKKGDAHAELVATFPGEDLFQEDLHSASFYSEDAIYFIPLQGKGISIYSPQSDQIQAIKLDNAEGARSHFITYAVIDDGILLIPQYRESSFTFLDLKQRKVESIEWLDQEIDEELSGSCSNDSWETFSANSAYVYKGIIYLVVADTRKLLIIDFKSKMVRSIFAPYDVHFRGLTGSGSIIWFTVIEDLVISYDISKAEWGTIDIPFVATDKKYPYLVTYGFNNDLIIIPGRDDKLIHFHNNAWESIAFPDSYTREVEKCLLTMRCFVLDNKIFMYPRAASGVLVYDFYSGITESFEMRYEQSFLRTLCGKLSREYMMNSQVQESVDYALGDYLIGIVDGLPDEGENV